MCVTSHQSLREAESKKGFTGSTMIAAGSLTKNTMPVTWCSDAQFRDGKHVDI